MGTCKLLGKLDEMLEGILAMDWCPIQGDWDKLWLDGALTCSYITDLPLRLKKKKRTVYKSLTGSISQLVYVSHYHC